MIYYTFVLIMPLISYAVILQKKNILSHFTVNKDKIKILCICLFLLSKGI